MTLQGRPPGPGQQFCRKSESRYNPTVLALSEPLAAELVYISYCVSSDSSRESCPCEVDSCRRSSAVLVRFDSRTS